MPRPGNLTDDAARVFWDPSRGSRNLLKTIYAELVLLWFCSATMNSLVKHSADRQSMRAFWPEAAAAF
jgi:hypothetical protein